MTSVKSTLFVSHATPEDNEFVRWLSAKLMLAGYSVWYDLDRLKGGDLFWDKIESALRHRAIRCLAVVSNASHTKDGVKNEWALAATLEKKLPGFVIPLRLDQFDYSQLPILLHQKNVIDFHRGWHFGLSELLDSLAEAQIARIEGADPAFIRPWLPLPFGDVIVGTAIPEVLDSNILAIEAWPPSIETARILSSQRQIPVTEANRKIPWFEFENQIVGFASRHELVDLLKAEVMLQAHHAIETTEFLRGRGQYGGLMTEPEAKARAIHLLRQAWDLHMEGLGLKQFELANHNIVWYVPPGLVPNNKYAFVEPSGSKRRKLLVGRSEKLKANWHYGISIQPLLTPPARLELRAHIIFTDDEGKPFEPTRMHRLRRSFCKSWWNDRWRGFLLAFLQLAALGKDTIELRVGENRAIKLAATPTTFESPVGLSDYTAALAEDDETAVEIEAAELDSGEVEPEDDEEGGEA